MPEPVDVPGQLRPGDLFEDCRYHPCLCYDVGDPPDTEAVYGISLVDGSTCHCSIRHCGLRKLSPAEAWQWKSHGPPAADVGHLERGRKNRVYP
jgi:hypothetical protein